MSEPLWKLEDYVRFVSHENPSVRYWALDQLEKYGASAKDHWAALIEDENLLVRDHATHLLGKMGSAEDGARLLQLFQASTGNRAGSYAAALGQLRYAPASSELIKRLLSGKEALGALRIIQALGRIGGEEIHTFLRAAVKSAPENTGFTAALAGALLEMGEADDIPFVVDQYFGLKVPEKFNPLLTEFQRVTQIEGLADSFRQGGPGQLERTVVAAESRGVMAREDLAPRFVAALEGRSSHRQVEATIEMIHQEALRLGHQRGLDVAQALPTSLQNLSPYQRLSWTRLLFIDAFRAAGERLSGRQRRRRRRAQSQEVQFLLANLLSLAGTPDYDALLQAAEDRTAALLEIVLADRAEVPEEFVAEIIALGPAVVPTLQQVLEEDTESWGALRAAEILNAVAETHPEACIPAIPALMKGLRDEVPDGIQEECKASLQRIGEPVLEEAARVLVEGDSSQKFRLLEVLEEIPVERSVDLILEHYDELLEEWDEPTVEALSKLGSSQAIEVLRPDALAGEPLFEDAFLLLCDLHGREMEGLDSLRARHSEREDRLNQRLEAFQSATRMEDVMALDEEEEMRLQLKCQECGRVYTYEVGKVIYCPKGGKKGPREEDFFLQKHIHCKNCGAEDRYQLTSRAYASLTAELMKLTLQSEEERKGPLETSRLLIAENFGLADGTRCTPHEAIAIYHQRIAEDPDNPEHRFRFGHVLRFLGRIEEAQEQYQAALRLDPTCLQAHFHLGLRAHEEGHQEKMETHMQQVLDCAPQSKDPQRRELIEVARDLLAGRSPELELNSAWSPTRRQAASPPPDRKPSRWETPPDPATPAVSSQKVGRNDPCPCGSGKKFKRCCGR